MTSWSWVIQVKLNSKYHSLVTISNALIWVACYLKDAFWNGLKGLQESWTILKAFFSNSIGSIEHFSCDDLCLFIFCLYDNSTYYVEKKFKNGSSLGTFFVWRFVQSIGSIEKATYLNCQLFGQTGQFLAVLKLSAILL